MTGELFHNEKHQPLDAILPAMIERYAAKHHGARPGLIVVHQDQDPGISSIYGIEIDTTTHVQRWHVLLVEGVKE